MTMLVEDKKAPGTVAPPPATIKQKCAQCLKGPNLIKTLVILVCAAIVIQQLTACIGKLINVPITTYTHFDFNKTIMYPSVTFCREPPYKFDVMDKYGLYAHPRFTSVWVNYNFSKPLDELWDEITYTPEDFFAQYGLDGEEDNVEVIPTMGFAMGRCFTLVPKAPNTRAGKSAGYSIMLQHSAEDAATSTSIYPPGYHVFVHYTREVFTEVDVYNGGLVDYFYVNTGETLNVKLTVDEYCKISDDDDPCTTGSDYSANKCTSQCVWDKVGEEAGCSGPWMRSELPPCHNDTAITKLISTYMTAHINHECSSCPRFCSAFLYNAFITERQRAYVWDTQAFSWAVRTGDAAMQTQLYMYFTSMMVSVYEESYNYDWNMFISDLGGSVGFLLGLSVIGLMTIIGKLWFSIIKPFIKTPNEKSRIDRMDSISSSAITAKADDSKADDKARLNSEDVHKKCEDWNRRNNLGDFI